MEEEERLIEKIRQEMIQCALKYGMKNHKTIGLSRKLDEILNRFEYEKQKSKCQ